MTPPKILFLSVKKIWFDLMYKQTKKIEIRKSSKWIESRLINKTYSHVKFINGYGHDKPFFICEFKGYEISKTNKIYKFDAIELKQNIGDYVIKLGNISEKGNIRSEI